MSDYLLDGHQIRTFAAVFIALFLTSCIQEAEWTWTGDSSQQDATADQVTQDGTVDLPGPAVLVIAIPAVFSGESSGGIWTLRPMVPGGTTVGQASAGGPWTLKAVLKGGSDAE